MLAELVALLGGHGAVADARELGLAHADGGRQAAEGHAEAGEDAADGSRAAGHEGLGAVVDVEHHAVGALAQHVLAAVERVVELEGRVYYDLVPEQVLPPELEAVEFVAHVVHDASVAVDQLVELTLLAREGVPV